MNSLKRSQLVITMVGAFFIAALLVYTDAFGAGGDCRSNIGGRVTRRSDSGPLPHPRAPVHLVNERGERLRTVRTDRDGAYVFENVCRGVYTVYPGPLLVEDTEHPPIPSLYTPASARVWVPVRINDAINPARINFIRNEPPHRQPDDYEQKNNETIKIDESTRGGMDMEMAVRIREFLAITGGQCPDPRWCNLIIKVRDGHVELSGKLSAQDVSSSSACKARKRGLRLI
ncbi:MAG TPA: carboxypeptidase-like regulatory domain-containing protein [Blastocatellia bacterium]|nr:carboxypeptidase-like regulatory domain-containing protein [Blastocatellia bacterium]